MATAFKSYIFVLTAKNCFETSKDFRAEIINLNKDKPFVKKLFKQSKLININ